jgi:hypothetical protein
LRGEKTSHRIGDAETHCSVPDSRHPMTLFEILRGIDESTLNVY